MRVERAFVVGFAEISKVPETATSIDAIAHLSWFFLRKFDATTQKIVLQSPTEWFRQLIGEPGYSQKEYVSFQMFEDKSSQTCHYALSDAPCVFDRPELTFL